MSNGAATEPNGQAAGRGGARAAARRRARPAEPPPTHGDILDAVSRVGGRQNESERQADLMAMTLQRLEKAVTDGFAAVGKEMADVRRAIGEEGEDEYGKPIGTGVVGRLMRLEHRFGGWRRWVAGAGATLLVLAPVIWFLVEKRVEFLR